MLTFHLLSFSHSPKTPPPATVLHSQSPGPPPEETLHWITKQPYSDSPSFCVRACLDSTRSLQVKTARGHTIISNPLISRPWPPRQQEGRQRGVLGATKHRSTGMKAACDHFTDLWRADVRVKLYSARPPESITRPSTAFSDHRSSPQRSRSSV